MKNIVIVVIYQIFKQHSTYAKYTNDQDDDTSEYVFTTLQNQQLQKVPFYSLKSDYEDAWISDIGATQHMTFLSDFFWTVQECQLNPMFLVNDTTHTHYGKGSLKVYLPDRK